ncbi:glutathione-S-transferase theta, GST [Pseudovirgaria hyperparasitica]|uniref:Glutathione-S-transferase theta, GST n=1 Tax=Pseudovirgaria hyperparasitica TaxID=470096 RepID=A0A6A6VWF8_9PEZI|nr:glutathione-S-transferase theta, GST [Pseudovirgaria hyperparasitica]KAF2753571.1 glutathione-S-transferase theta, GST [Pseudovirgaria hyperparasitica]
MAYILYGYERNPRTRVCRIIAAAEGIELSLSEVVPRRGVNKAKYMERFPRSRGKIPALETADTRLTETIAIAVYLATLHNRSRLMGDGSPQETAEILSWANWANQEFLQIAAQWFLPLIPSFTDPPSYNKDAVSAGRAATLDILEFLETHLTSRIYIATEHISIADIMLVIYISRLFEWVLDRKWREVHPSVMGYFERVTSFNAVQAVIPRHDFIMIEEETPNKMPDRIK